jgi:hypothetical protein
MRNIRWLVGNSWTENCPQKKSLIRDTVRVNIITTIGAFLVEPIRSQVPALAGSNSRKNIKY